MTHFPRSVRLLVLAVLIPATSGTWSEAADQAIEEQANGGSEFDRDVLPILRARCFECHGPDVQESGLRIDSRPALLTGGDFGPAIVPGEPSKTEILRRMAATDPGERTNVLAQHPAVAEKLRLRLQALTGATAGGGGR